MNNVENLNAENVATELFNVATELVHDRLNEFGGGDNGAVGPDDHEPDDEKDEPVQGCDEGDPPHPPAPQKTTPRNPPTPHF